ncbi:hypothetical protein BH10ACI1_BH10ACI1_22780 [soil metagenome]
MGKLLKYCAVCEEGFAERFGFCPNCGGQLEAFEMKRVAKESENIAESKADSFVQSVKSETSSQPETPAFIPATMAFSGDDILELDGVDTPKETMETEPETLTAEVETVNSNGNGYQSNVFEENLNSFKSEKYENADDYHVTVVSEEASSWFKPFLLGLMALAFATAIGSYAYAIWIFSLQVAEVDGVNMVLYSSLADDDPMQLEEIKLKKNKEQGGGGGGGGKENPDPASKGRLPDQTDKPTLVMPVPVIPNASLPIQNQTQGNVRREQTDEQVGIPNSLSSKTSSGGGIGNGIGNGNGNGVGNGRGNGNGNGIGNGEGNGIGNGNGNGLGDGDGDRTTPTVTKKEVVSGVTKSVTITSKPKPRYTDAARQNNVQGTVTLRVTFNANGTIGSVSPVNSLPYGLTEQAISAAKQIQFEPAMRNGQAYSVTKQVQYNFTIY